MSQFSFTVKKQFSRKADEVFAALTNAASIEKWMGQKGSVSTRVGGRIHLFDGWVKGKVISYEKPHKVSYTWKPSDWSTKSPASLVEIILKDKKGGTEVTLTHSNFPNSTESSNHKSGWFEYFFDPLEAYFSS